MSYKRKAISMLENLGNGKWALQSPNLFFFNLSLLGQKPNQTTLVIFQLLKSSKIIIIQDAVT